MPKLRLNALFFSLHRSLNSCLISALFSALVISPLALAADATTTVKQFVNAFNQRQISTMLELAAPNMQWMSVTGQSIATETSSHDQLKKAMLRYFASVPSAQSALLQLNQSGQFVYALEKASWLVKDQEKSQCSMAVYELANNKIQHVWYFASHQCPDASKPDTAS